MSETAELTIREQAQADAEAFVKEQMDRERAELQTAIDNATRLEREVAKEHKKHDDAYWKLAKRDFDAEPDEKEIEARRVADASLNRLQGVSQAISANMEKLARLDNDFSRRVRLKRDQLERSRNGGNGNDKGGKMSKASTPKRVPVPEATIKRVVELVKTKSQQEVADILNKEGKTTASGKDWTPQNIWHLVKKATGKGVPRKAAKANGGARKTAAKKATAKPAAKKAGTAKPLSKKSQASGTSRGGTGSKKKTTSRRRVTRKR